MRIIISAVLLFILVSPCWAVESIISKNKEVELCIKIHGENDDECLSDVSDETERLLADSYSRKLKEITAFDYTRWWRGTAEQKERMLALFKKNQQEWMQYRNDYCDLISTQAQGTHVFTENMLSCIVNMNEARVKEIDNITL